MPLRFDEHIRAQYRAHLLRKGHAVATKLADLLAGKGKRIQLSELPSMAGKPGMRPEERLRAFLDHIEACRHLLDAGDDQFGRCLSCSKDLGTLALEQMPWADLCQDCTPSLSV